MQDKKIEKATIFKKVLLYVLFSVELFFLLRIVSTFVKQQEYLSLSSKFAIPFSTLLLFTLWTITVISETQTKKWEFFVPPTILFFSIFISLSAFQITEAFIGSLLITLFFSHKLQVTKIIGESLLKVRLKISGKSVVRGLQFSISSATALIVFLSSDNFSSTNVGDWAADIIEEPVKDAIEREYKKEVPEQITSLNLESLEQSNPQISAVLKSFGIKELPTSISLPDSTTDNIVNTIKNSISDQVNKALDPYRSFFSPALALLVFGLMQLYGSIVYFAFLFSIDLFVYILKKTNFIKVKKIPTEKEILQV